MLLVGQCWRQTLKVAAVLLLLIAAELELIDARSMRSLLLRRHGLEPSSTTPGRWLTPCGGGTTAETPTYSTSSDTSSTDVDFTEDVTSQHGRRRLLRRLARQMSRLADRVDRLKLRYADHRFRDDVDTLDQLGFHLEGMPNPTPDVNDVDEVIGQALSDLTRVAPFLEAALDGELRHEHGRNFVHDYRRILDDAEHGFYWVLCQLHRLHSTVVDTDSSRTASVTNFTLPAPSGAVQSNAIRHYHDYVVLRDFGRLLDSYRHLLWNRRARHDKRSRTSRDLSEVL